MANTEDLKSSEVTPLVGSSPTSGTNKIVVRVYRYVILKVPKGTPELEIRKQAIELLNKIPNEEALLIYNYGEEVNGSSSS